jgi:hypothetical protein
MQKIELDGHTYSKEDVEAMREQLIGWRDASMDQWPDPGAIAFTTGATHLVGFLAGVIKQYPEGP